MLTITSIYGPEKVMLFRYGLEWFYLKEVMFQKSFETIIYNKNHIEEEPPPSSPDQLRSPSEASHTSGFDERSLDSALLSPFR